MAYQMVTKRNYDFGECASALQKAIRRNEPAIAGYFALELYASGYQKYVWKRLLTVSAEDCGGLITREIKALHSSWEFINGGKTTKDPKGRIFLSKAILLLCDQIKNRDPDHLQNLIYDKKVLTDEQVQSYLNDLEESEKIKIPDYAFDVHTYKGKRMGMTKEQFFKDEFACLEPRQEGLFDNLIE